MVTDICLIFGNTAGRRHNWGGNVTNWWSEKLLTDFTKRAMCIVKQYSKYKLDVVGKNVSTFTDKAKIPSVNRSLFLSSPNVIPLHQRPMPFGPGARCPSDVRLTSSRPSEVGGRR